MPSRRFIKLTIGVLLVIIGVLGYRSFCQKEETPPSREIAPGGKPSNDTAQETTKDRTHQDSHQKSEPNQANNLLAQLTAGIDQLQNFPFRPVFGDEIFEPNTSLTDTTREKWKRHCQLRKIYQSERIREPGFQALNKVMAIHGLADDLVQLSDIHDIVFSLNQAIDYATDYSPELVSDSWISELDEFLEQTLRDHRQQFAFVLGHEISDQLLVELKQIKIEELIGDPSTHIEPGERIILQ